MSEEQKPKTEYAEQAGQEAGEPQTGQGDGKRQRRRGGGPSSILAPGEKPKDFRKAVGDTLRYMGGYKFAVAVVIVVSAIATVFETVGPKVMGRATTLLAEGVMNKIHGTGGIDFDAVARVLLLTMALYFIGAIAQYIQALIMTNITQKIVYRMRRDISEKINRMPIGYFERVQTGEILSRITNDVDTLGQSLSQSISNFIWAIISMLGIIIVMLTINVTMTLIALMVIPLSALVMGMLIKISQKHFAAQQKYLGIIDGQVEETFSGHLVVKAFNREAAVTEEFNRSNEKLYESAWKSQFLSGMMRPLMRIVSNLGYAAVVVAGGVFCVRGAIGVGDIQAFVQYVKNIGQPIQDIAQIMNQVQSMAAAAERVFEFLNEDEELDAPGADEEMGEIKGAVEFRHVRFGYKKDHPVIRDFSAKVEPGQKIAIVGPTGAGKTTMVKLLMRFYDVDGGAILIDGRDIREFTRKELRDNFAMVLQDTWLFSGTIRENIAYGREGATNEEIIRAAKTAKAHHFIKALPGGYKMMLNEDATNISEGQRQLLTIARAVLADKRLLILDEATSSVDTRTEEEIQKAMDALTEDRTSFIIAHRLSTIRNADLILVMDHGDIVEQGTHEELLAKGGAYAELYNSQFEEVG
ncbi:MAG: ABC transporter ATP-binding protein [Mogibacterium sp.]|nr:ABC transporter ATP-binding protein [Mogibacterium sp.]MBR4089463.1 ABC transporter ATP-binding protein [Mogibacterium sp.]